MFGINLVAHVTAAIAFVLMLVMLIRQHQDRLWLNELFRPDATKIVVGWPHQFLKRLCSMIGVDFDWRGEVPKKPRRLQQAVWAKTVVELGVSKIVVETIDTSWLVSLFGTESALSSERVSELQEALGKDMRIDYRRVSAQHQGGESP